MLTTKKGPWYNYNMERKISFAPEEYFHIYNRGVDKREIFNDRNDYQRFLESLYLFNSKERIVLRAISRKDRFNYNRGDTLVDIGAYCIMPNHFHLLVKSKDDLGISVFMKKLLTAYSMYFNKKYNRSGVLFQGAFKAEHVGRDEYLKYLYAYIHLNPVKILDPEWKEKGIKDVERSKEFLKSYENSSYLDYIEEGRPEVAIINRSVFPEYFNTKKVFDDFIEFWLLYCKDNTTKDSPW